jgi:DNA-binding response OmpR family regulator
VVHQPDEEELPKRDPEIRRTKSHSPEDIHTCNDHDGVATITDCRNKGEKARILLIDSDPLNSRTIHNFLGTDYSITSTVDIDDAFDEMRKSKTFDLVLLNLTMTEKSGYEICNKIRKRYDTSELPIIVQTVKPNVDDINKALDYGANDYIIKPFSQVEIHARIKTHLRNREVRYLKEKVNTLLTSQQDEFRIKLVQLLSSSLDYWTRTTQKTKFDLAQESGLWKLYLDKSTFKTRTMDKYLNINTLPKKPRSENVIKTAEFVLDKCPSVEPWRKELEDLLVGFKQLLQKKLKN